MVVRCKMRLDEIRSYPNTTQQTFIFNVCYDDKIPEDQRFYKYTPSGHMQITVDNPNVQESYKLGNYYYFDSIQVPQKD